MHIQQFSTTAVAVSMSLLFAATNAHMKMKTPAPYGSSSLDNSPLKADGSDFPCKLRTGVYDLEGASNVMAIGESQTLSFLGSAVHGGGSCQVSLTTDLQPTKDSKWMVIKSIEGGCPANVPGNLPDDPNGTGASTFQYSIPEGIAPGQYTIAWSWLNKIGNREFYMNCGPATVTAAKKKRYAPTANVSKRQSSFPAMYVANLVNINTCKTTEGDDYQYPDGGADITSSGEKLTPLDPGCAGQSTVQSTPPESSNSTSSEPAGSSPVDNPPSTPPSASPGVFASGAASASDAAPQATSTATVAPVPAASPSTGSSGSSDASSNVAGSPCSDEGAWACAADGSSFQRCASGVWSVSMAMSEGTSCTPGTSDNLNMTTKKLKRHVSHIRRSHKGLDRSLS